MVAAFSSSSGRGRPTALLAVVLGALAFLGGCSGADDEVEMTDDFTFDPSEITVAAGSTVTFTNDSGAPHTVTAYSDGVPGGEYFSSGGFGSEADARDGLAEALIEGDGTFRVTLDEPGTYRYFCIPHEGQGMKGTITIE